MAKTTKNADGAYELTMDCGSEEGANAVRTGIIERCKKETNAYSCNPRQLKVNGSVLEAKVSYQPKSGGHVADVKNMIRGIAKKAETEVEFAAAEEPAEEEED